MKYCHYLFVALGITSAAILASCQDEDFGYTADQIAYRTNFEKMYGSVKDIPTWDFSSYNLRQMGLAGGPSAVGNATRSAATHSWNDEAPCHGAIPGATLGEKSTIANVAEEYYTVEGNTLTWLNKYLTEGNDHRTMGTPFKLVKPEEGDDFLIIPVYQGHSGMTWDLHLVAENSGGTLMDYKIWEHSENIQIVKDYSQTGGVEFFYNTADPSNAGGDISVWDANGVVKEIMLKRAFPGFSSVSDENAKLYLEVPAGGYVKAIITNKNDVSSFENKNRWNIEVNNTGSSPLKYTVGINGIKSQGWFPSDLWNLVLRIEYYSGCTFDTFDSEHAVRLFTEYPHSETVTLSSTDCGSSTQNFINRHTIAASQVLSKPIRVDCSKIKDDFYFYLDVVKGDEYVTGDNDQAATGTRQSSDDGMMLALLDNATTEKLVTSSSALATSLNSVLDMNGVSSCEYFVIGCEDANLKDSDWDTNDVVFLVVGLDKAPKIKELIKKRYMIEDLGGTFDFDFNDIVVDVTQERLKNVSDGTYSNTFGNGGYKQYATLKHLCGTIPFKIQIGNTVIGNSYNGGKYEGKNGGCSEGEYGYDPTNDSYYAPLMNAEVTGWNPSANNIIVTTWPTQAGWTDPGTGGYVGNYPDGVSFSFPENKQYPYIIACDQTVMWMPELTSVPHSWFKTWKDDNYLNWTPTAPDNNQPVTPPTPTPTTVDLSSDKIGDGWNADKASYPTVTFSQNWAGFQWWYGGEDFSGYSKIVVTYTRAEGSESLPLKLVVEYTTENGTNDKGEKIYQQSESALVTSGGSLEVTLSNDYKSSVRQIFIQNGEAPGTITVTRAYAEQ